MKPIFGLDLPFYSYGILMGIAFLLGVWLFKHNSKKAKSPTPPFIDLVLVLSICGVIGARLNYILLFPEYYKTLRDVLAIHEGGMVFYGGFILALIGLISYCKVKKYSFALVADYMVPSLALGHALGRIGCLINNCCYGKITQSIRIYHIDSDPENCFRHPTQLYEIAYLLILAGLFQFIIKKGWERKSGIIAAYYTISYAILRYINEFFRADNRGGFFTTFNLSPAQITSIILVICGILCLCIINKKSKTIADCGVKNE